MTEPPGVVLCSACQLTRWSEGFTRVVAEHGYQQATVARVAAAARLPEDSFPHHFGDLEECFVHVYETGAARLLAAVRVAHQGQAFWRDAVRAMLGTYLETLAAEPAFTRLFVVEACFAGGRVRQSQRHFILRLREMLVGPDLPALPEPVLDAVVGGIASTIYIEVVNGRTRELPALLPTLSYLALLPYVDKDQAQQELLRTGPYGLDLLSELSSEIESGSGGGAASR